MLNLDQIRKIFPDWPSEYDSAKQVNIWVTLAQEYYHAALILDDEITKNHKYLHEHEYVQRNDKILIRMGGHNPAIFCFAFALELLIKAVYIKQVAGHTMVPNQSIGFANHKISILVAEIKDIVISKEERELIPIIERIVCSGKYPTNKKPSDRKLRDKLPQFSDFRLLTEPLYNKLMAMA